MPTTARGIWTPSDTDAVDFTTHLATMANTIETALNSGANASKGTAAQRAAFLSTAVNGMLWQDTDSIKMIWRKDGAAWVPAVWRWSGTTAQMNAFAAPNGFEWFNTIDNSGYVRLGGSWTMPIQRARDVLIQASAAANTSYFINVTFPVPFPTVPTVLATFGSNDTVGAPVVSVGNLSTTGFRLAASSSVSRNLYASWVAFI